MYRLALTAVVIKWQKRGGIAAHRQTGKRRQSDSLVF
jgi:hypothetical protein